MKKNYFKLALLILALTAIAAPPNANAQIVPCLDEPCTPCDLWELASNIVWFLLFDLGIPILTVALLTGGVMILISGGNSSLKEKGKSIIWNGLIGILIAFTAYLIINTIIATLANGRFTAGWSSIDSCPAVGTSGGTTQPPTTQPPSTCTPACTAPQTCQNGTCVAPPQGLKCNASSASPAVSAMVTCVINTARQQGLTVPQPTLNQLNGGSHVCNLSTNNISCHYGGTQCNGTGNAADFNLPASQRTSANWATLRNIAVSCGAAGGAFCEQGSVRFQNCAPSGIDHIHANASASCGCQ